MTLNFGFNLFLSFTLSDDVFLLQFLRVKKYSTAEAFKRFEKFLVTLETYPKWFDNLSLDDKRLSRLFETGYIFPLRERDKNGCRVILLQAGKPDAKKFSYLEFIRMITLVCLTVLEEPETQVTGVSVIANYANVKMDYLSCFPVKELMKFFQSLTNSLPLRAKRIAVVNLPTIAVTLAELTRTVLSKKINERMIFSSDDKTLFDEYEKKILPTEYGGEVSIKEMMDDFRFEAKKHEKNIQLTSSQRINLSLVKNVKVEQIESFRKLEID